MRSIVKVSMPAFYRAFLNNEGQFKRYAAGYIEKSYPDLKPVKGQPVRMVIECKRKEIKDENGSC